MSPMLVRVLFHQPNECWNTYEQLHVSGSRSLNKTKRLKTAHEEEACRTDATTSCLCAFFDKPIRLRAAVRQTNQNSCLCSPVVSLLFAVFIFRRTYENCSIFTTTSLKTNGRTDYLAAENNFRYQLQCSCGFCK